MALPDDGRLPLLPVLCVIVGTWYSRRRTTVFVLFVVLQAAENIGHIALLTPPTEMAGDVS